MSGEGGPLLSAEFLRSLEQLRVALRRALERGDSGVRRSHHRKGASVEFAEHRAYVPGDDPRRIDWRAFARLGELVVRLFVAEHDAAFYLLLDRSISMRGEALARAKVLCAAAGYLALTGTERVSLAIAGDEADSSPADSSPADSSRAGPFRGRAAVPAFLRALDAVQPNGRAALDRAAERLVARGARPGVALLVSDLFEEERALAAARRLAVARYEVTALHVLDARTLDPSALDGECTLVDAEDRSELALTVDDEARALYRARLSAWCEGLARSFRARGARYVPAHTTRAPLSVLAETLTRTALSPARSAPERAP